MQKRLVTRYTMRSPEAANENQQRVEGVSASSPAFAHFQESHADRRDGSVDQQTATLVGAYITTID